MDTEQVIEPTQPENGNSPNTDEELELDLELEDEPVEESKAEDSKKPKRFDEMTREEAIAAAKQLWIQKQKAKQKQTVPQQKPPLNSQSDVPSRDELVLIARGVSDEEIKVLKRIQAGAKAEGADLTLAQAMEDEVFVAFKEKKEKERRKEKAQLGASGGSTHRDYAAKPGMTAEEHKELWKKAQG